MTPGDPDDVRRDEPPLADLVVRARFGEQTAWNGLVDRLAPLVWSVCRRYRLSPADADDVAQSAWLKLLEHLPDIREPAAVPGWLATTTSRECLRVLRISSTRTSRETAIDQDLPTPVGVPSAEDAVLAAERNAALRTAFAALPASCQRLIRLLLHDPPLASTEIGERLGVPEGGLGPTRARCLKKMRLAEPLAALIRGDVPAGAGGRR